MEINELITKYELVFIIDANLNESDKETLNKEIAEAIQKGGGKVINSHIWLEKQKMTFPIKKCNDGTYSIVSFEGEHSAPEKIRSTLKLNEKILRFAFAKVEK